MFDISYSAHALEEMESPKTGSLFSGRCTHEYLLSGQDVRCTMWRGRHIRGSLKSSGFIPAVLSQQHLLHWITSLGKGEHKRCLSPHHRSCSQNIIMAISIDKGIEEWICAFRIHTNLVSEKSSKRRSFLASSLCSHLFHPGVSSVNSGFYIGIDIMWYWVYKIEGKDEQHTI